MKQTILYLALLFSFQLLSAQDITKKVILQKGDIIKVKTDMNSTTTQSMMGGDPMEMKTNSNSLTELEVVDVLPDGYQMKQTLKTMKLDFDGFGQKINYDSESKEKQDNPFIKQIAEKIGVAELLKLGFDGMEIEMPEDKKTGNKKEGRGMMRMMSGGAGGSNLGAAFLIFPEGAVANNGWTDTTEKDGLKTIKKYTLSNIMGSLASVSILSQTKGELAMNQNGMTMTTVVNTTTEEMMMVNIENGRVQMHTVTMRSNNKTLMNDKESPSTGVSTISTVYE